jgi:hypothetical protein
MGVKPVLMEITEANTYVVDASTTSVESWTDVPFLFTLTPSPP